MENSKTHFFAIFIYGWATAATREEAIEKLIAAYRNDFKRIAVTQMQAYERGAYIWTCEVCAPESSEYRIEFYKPKGVEIQNAREAFVTMVTAKGANYWIAKS